MFISFVFKQFTAQNLHVYILSAPCLAHHPFSPNNT